MLRACWVQVPYWPSWCGLFENNQPISRFTICGFIEYLRTSLRIRLKVNNLLFLQTRLNNILLITLNMIVNSPQTFRPPATKTNIIHGKRFQHGNLIYGTYCNTRDNILTIYVEYNTRTLPTPCNLTRSPINGLLAY